MDKNTLIGALLMGAVIIGFMWLNQPSEAELAARRQAAEQQAAERLQEATSEAVITVDTISEAERKIIASTISQYGVMDSVSGVTTLATDKATLQLTRDGLLQGSVAVGNTNVSLSQLLTGPSDDLPVATATKAVATLKGVLASVARYQGFSRHLYGEEKTLRLENEKLALDFSTKGGVISRALLKEYKTYDSTQVQLMAPDIDMYSFTLTTATQRFETSEFYFTPVQENDSTITMLLDLGDGARWGIRYTLPSTGYLVKMDILQEGMQTVIPSSVATMDFSWHQKMARNEAGRMFEERNSALYYMFINGDVENLKEGSSQRKEVNERVKWIAYKNQFFSALIVPQTNFTSAVFDSEVLENDMNFLKEFDTQATVDYSSTLANPASFTFFFGPNSYPLLSDLQHQIVPEENLHLTNLVPLGWTLFRWINQLIVIPVFDFFGGFIKSYGIIILLLTIFIKLIIFPFTYKSYISQAKMRLLQPEIQEINERYPGNENAMKRQQETMALYSRAGASPFSGCLPMLLQLPILVAMFNFFPSAIELRGQSFLWAKDLSAPDAIVSWTTNIPLISSTFGNHISLFCLLMTVVNIIYTRITMQSQASNNTMPGMKWMMYLMPVMFLVFFNNYAAGLSYYYFLSLLITIVQTYIFRRCISEEKMRAKMRENAKKPKKKSGFMARLEEAQKRQQALLREQERQRAKGKR
ncbi:MAG: membrane protein insertase YidC [Bacteroidales bacterium]|nr:membrane protein insertase YidC [Bacteroidales bacterium]